MKRFICKLKKFCRPVLFMLMLCLILPAAGCSGAGTGGDYDSLEESTGTVAVTDDLGRTVEVPYKPERTAVLIGSFADVWQLAGGEVTAAANDAWTSFDLGLSDDVVDLGATTDLSLELLFDTDPELVIASTNTQIDLDWMEILEDAGIPVIYFDVNSFDDYLNMLYICTQITGCSGLYEENGLKVQERIEAAIAKSTEALAGGRDPWRVLYLRATAVSVKAKGSSDNVLGEMLRDLGCVNIADGSVYLDDLSMERIIIDDPDYIFIVEQGQDTDAIEAELDEMTKSNPAWSGLTAVLEDRVYYMDGSLYNLKPNSRWGDAYEQLEEILYE